MAWVAGHPTNHYPHGVLERSIHTTVLLGSVTMFLYSAYSASEELKDSVLLKYHLRKGWPFFDRMKDVSDEWMFWKYLYVYYMWKWFALHILLGQICKLAGVHEIKKYLFTLCHMTFLYTTLGSSITAFHCVQVVLPIISAHFTASKKFVWLSSLGIFMLYDASYAGKPLNKYIPLLAPGSALNLCQEYLFQVGIMRSTSSALFICERRSPSGKPGSHVDLEIRKESESMENPKTDLKWSWADVVCYNFYFPIAVFGPFITFEEFLIQFNRPPAAMTAKLLKKMSTNILKSCFWIIAHEAILHFFYYSSILKNPSLLEDLPLWTVMGLACLQAQMFMVKHFIIWTLVSPVSDLDRLETPSAPSCVCRVYLYSDMWKSFDKGFYIFLKEHIYLPLGGSRQGTTNYVLALTLTFAFALFFHGTSSTIVTWIVINVVSMFMEKMIQKLFSIDYFDPRKGSWISQSWIRRLHSLFHVPLFVFATFGSFLFLAGQRAAYVIAYKIFFQGLPLSYVMLLLGCYSFIQTAKDYENHLFLKTFKKNQ